MKNLLGNHAFAGQSVPGWVDSYDPRQRYAPFDAPIV